ncbi:MAG: ABC transporter permease [Planctomycetota bacterium]
MTSSHPAEPDANVSAAPVADGPELAGLGVFGTLIESARQTLVMLCYRRVLTVTPFVLLVMLGLSFVLSGRVGDRLDGLGLFCVITWWTLGTVVVPWMTIYLGVQALHGELEDRTSQYLFLRPVHRIPMLLGKWLGITLISTAIAIAATFALWAGVAAHGDLWPDGRELAPAFSFAYVLAAGVVAYSAVAMFLAATFRRPLAWAAFFVVGVQMVAANLPVSAGLRSLTITDPLRRLLMDQLEPSRRLASYLWPAERGEALDVFLQEEPAHALAWGAPLSNLLVFAVVCLLLGCWRYAATEYESRSRD